MHFLSLQNIKIPVESGTTVHENQHTCIGLFWDNKNKDLHSQWETYTPPCHGHRGKDRTGLDYPQNINAFMEA